MDTYTHACIQVWPTVANDARVFVSSSGVAPHARFATSEKAEETEEVDEADGKETEELANGETGERNSEQMRNELLGYARCMCRMHAPLRACTLRSVHIRVRSAAGAWDPEGD